MAFWIKWFKGPNELSGLDDALAQRDAIYQIGRENTQWVMDALVKQRDDARAALAAREAEIVVLRGALVPLARLDDDCLVDIVGTCGDAALDQKMRNQDTEVYVDTNPPITYGDIRAAKNALADHTP